MTEWREVCRWDVGPSRYPEDHAMTDHVEALRRNVWAYREAFDAALAAFEELAGEHLIVRDALADVLKDVAKSTPPSPGPGWYWVRGHWRSRRVACQGIPDTSTEICRAEAGDSKDTAEGDIAVLGASGDARGASCDEAPARIKGE